jgi:outer membrane protein assembly factor BamB
MKQILKGNKYSIFTLAALILFLICQFTLNAQQTNWTHFRGSNLDGISKETNIPKIWNDSLNVAWKIRINGKGWSSPVVFGDQVWLTTSTEDGKNMFGVCINSKTGKEIFNIKLFEPATTYSKHEINTYASPTPCIEKGFVYLHFGSYGTTCLNTSDGSVVWKRTDLNCDHVQGPGSSPITYKNLLILHLEGVDVQYIVALNKKTGETVWKKERPKDCYDKLEPIGKKAYITPLIIRINGKDLLISNGSAACIAYNPENGQEIWRVVQGEDSTISMPFFENGIVYFYTSFVTPKDGEKYCELLAVDPSGTGDITKTHVLWRFKSPVLQLLTPLIKDGLIYTVDTMNNLYCLDSKTGKTVYTKRLTGKYNSSPLYAGGNIYFTSTNGETLIIKEGPKLEIISRNRLKGEVFATPAIISNSIIIRAGTDLYCIKNK